MEDGRDESKWDTGYYEAKGSDCRTLGSLSSCYGEGNENVTKQYNLMRKTTALYVRYNFWYISSPKSAKRQREMTKFKVLWKT